MSERKIKIVKGRDVLVVTIDPKIEETQRRHDLAMLKLLIAKHTEKAREYLRFIDGKSVDKREGMI